MLKYYPTSKLFYCILLNLNNIDSKLLNPYTFILPNF